jgi:hypothetical protein
MLVIVEMHVQRDRSALHNFSGQLATVTGGKRSKLWMVEALPAESDAFWSSRSGRQREIDPQHFGCG